MPHRKSLALNWRLFEERYRLKGNCCTTCDTNYFPPRAVCPKCRRRGNLELLRFSGDGEVYSYSIIRVAPEGFEKNAPYVLAIVRLKEGPLVTSHITDIEPEDVSIGMPVRAVFRRIMEDGESGIIHYAFKFVKK